MIRDEIDDLKDCLIKQLLPVRIYLFGSFAENRQNPDSDIDFYIVIDDDRGNTREVTVEAYKSIRHRQKRSVDIIVNTASVFEYRKSMPSIEAEVARKGRILYER